MNTVRRFENWAGPMVMVVLIPLMIWSIVKAGGLGPVFDAESKYASFWEFLTLGFVSAVALFIAGSWSTLILNYPDLTRFARSNRQQVLGTFIGFPVASVVFYGMVAIIVSTVGAVTGKLSWEPADVLVAVGNKPLIIIGAILLTVATLSVNIAANLVSPSYDLANALPRWLTFRRAGALALVLAVVWNPWKVMEDPDSFFELFGYFAVVLGPATGILIADYLIVRERRIDIDDLYRRFGRYRAYRGFNIPGLAVLLVSTLICLSGAVFDAVDFLYTYGWFVGVGSASVLYVGVVFALRRWSSRPLPEFEPAGTEGNEAEEPGTEPTPLDTLPVRV
jgi:NCS1 family nucleobase:cation symporter-1